MPKQTYLRVKKAE